MILEDRDSEIYDAIEQSKNTYGMQTFEPHRRQDRGRPARRQAHCEQEAHREA